MNSEFSGPKRFIGDQTAFFDKYIAAANEYPPMWGYPFLKPYGNISAFFEHMYKLLDTLQALNLPVGSHLLEVGAGDGWVTEILMGLGYFVDSVEPSESFVAAAKKRVSSFARHLNVPDPEARVNIFCGTIEGLNPTDEKYDAVLFFDVFHHIIDENAALAKSFKALRKGGVICIQDGAWHPENKELEAALKEEMKTFGTLENPFTVEYLDFVLKKAGFDFIKRFYGINKVFNFADDIDPRNYVAAKDLNFVTAQKPWDLPTTRDADAKTTGEIEVIRREISGTKLTLNLRLKNTGESIWLSDPALNAGFVTLSLFNKHDRSEIARVNLREQLHPGDEIQISPCFTVNAISFSPQNYCVDLINEHRFWFGLDTPIS